MTGFTLDLINEGDSVRLRDGTVTTVEFIAYMPDDLHMDYEYVVRLSGYEAAAYTESGHWSEGQESSIDIIEAQGKIS